MTYHNLETNTRLTSPSSDLLFLSGLSRMQGAVVAGGNAQAQIQGLESSDDEGGFRKSLDGVLYERVELEVKDAQDD